MTRLTSQEALKSIGEDKARIRRDVLRFIRVRGPHGATCDEVEVTLNLAHQTASPRVYELHKRGSIVDSGQKRVTRAGRRAIVWVVKP